MSRRWLLLMPLLGGCVKQAPPPWVGALSVQGPDARYRGLALDNDLYLDPDTRSADGARRLAMTLETRLETDVLQWWHFLPGGQLLDERPVLDPTSFDEDAATIRRFFVERGFLHAEVTWEVVPLHLNVGRMPGVRVRNLREVVFHVEQGPLVSVSRVVVTGVSDLPAPLQLRLASATAVRRGRYDGARLARTKLDMLGILQGAGYPEATVTPTRTPLDADDEVVVTVEVSPGEPCGCDGVGIEGLEAVRATPLLRRLARPLSEGKLLSRLRLPEELSLQASFAEARFPATERWAPGDPPLRLEVTEAPRREVVPVGTIDIGNRFYAAQGGVRWTVRHLGGSLLSVQGRTEVGYSLLPSRLSLNDDHGPLVEHAAELVVPLHVLEPVQLFVGSEGAMRVNTGMHSVSGAGGLGVRWRPSTSTSLSLGVWGGGWHHFPFEGQRVRFDRAFADEAPDSFALGGPTLQRSYALLETRLHAEVDLRDRPVDPNSGLYGVLDLSPVMLARGRSWFRSELDLRGYVPLLPRALTLALRVNTGLLVRYGRGTALGLHGSRFFLGGAADLRGWPRRSLQPPEFEGARDDVQLGGDVLFTTSAELRLRPLRWLHVVAFVDGGAIWSGLTRVVGEDGREVVANPDLVDLQPSVGGGLRLPTPQGTLRIEAAYRLRPSTGLTDPPPRFLMLLAMGHIF